jgi:predicted dehydrogenase
MSRLSRREFLEESLLAGLSAAALPSVASALPTRRAGANERLRVAVLGVRGRGDAHVGAYTKMPDVEVAVLCDPDPSVIKDSMDKVEQRTGKKAQYVQDLRRVFEDKSIDAVSIATPNHWHVLASVWAIQAGKDVYVEKPLGHNLWEQRKLVEAARKHGKIVQQGNMPRSSSGVRAAIEFLRSGKLGKIQLARGVCYNRRNSIGRKPDAEVPAGVDYDLWQGAAPARPYNRNRFHYEWHWNWDYGNGELGNNGIYQMDISRWGLGKDEHPKKVLSFGGRFGYEDDGQTPNTQVTVLDYGDVRIIHEVRGLNTERYQGVSMGNIFRCAEGSLIFGNAGTVAYDPKGAELRRFTGEGDHFRNWVEAVKSRKRETLNSEVLEGHLSTSLCHLGNISYRLGEPQPLDRDNPFGEDADANETWRRFRDHLKEAGVEAGSKVRMGRPLAFDGAAERFADPEATAMLRREYRKPYEVPENL